MVLNAVISIIQRNKLMELINVNNAQILFVNNVIKLILKNAMFVKMDIMYILRKLHQEQLQLLNILVNNVTLQHVNNAIATKLVQDVKQLIGDSLL